MKFEGVCQINGPSSDTLTTAVDALDDQTTALANDEIMRRVPQLAQLEADQLLRAYLAREGFDPARLPSDFFREAGS